MSLFRGNFTNGHIGRFWDEEYKDLAYVRQPLLDSEIENWRSQGYDHVKSFSGSMYNGRNPMPDWVKNFDGLFAHLENKTYNFYKMQTLEIMPPHSDHYQTYIKLFNANPENVYRIVLFLEDWKPGHYFEVAGTAVTNWVAGDWYMWQGDTPHAASNIGIQDRYTLQITGEHKADDVFTSLHWFNFHDYPSKETTRNNYFINYLKKSVESDKPYYIYMLNRNIQELDNINHSLEKVEYYNKVGIIFHLFEPLCSYQNSIKDLFSHQFYKEFSTNITDDDLKAEELDSIYNYAKRNNLTNITVKTGDYNVEKWYTCYQDILKLECDDLFLKSIPINYKIKSSTNFKINKKFISLNWRYTPHRHLIASYLTNYEGNYSFYFRGDFSTLVCLNWLDWEKCIANSSRYVKVLQGIQFINQNSPLCLDISAKIASKTNLDYGFSYWPITEDYPASQTPAIHNPTRNSLQEFYDQSFVDVVTESRFAQPTGNYSEKTYQAIQYKRPFILAAPPNTLKYLKEQGFKTFSEFWDESYDDEYDHGKRLIKIFDLIDYIGNKSIEELTEILKQMEDILEFNYNHFKENKANKNG